MNTPVGPGGTRRRRRSDPNCTRLTLDMVVVYALVALVAVLNFTH